MGVTYAVNLKLDHTTVSSNHALLAAAQDGIMVTDLDSTNGTFVNNQRVSAPKLARSGDEIRFDTLTFIVTDNAAPATSSSQASPADDLNATVVRQAPPAAERAEKAEPADDDLANAQMGKTMIMAVNKNLPRSWQLDNPGTVILKPGEAENFSVDADALEAQYSEPTLVLLDEGGAGQPISLRSEGEFNFWNIGKNSAKHELSIIIKDPSVSDFHAKLVRRGQKWSVHDQMSTNKTKVNGEAVLKRFLASKDLLEFGGEQGVVSVAHEWQIEDTEVRQCR